MIAPTESELSILGVLWEAGPLTVREVNDVLNRQSSGNGEKPIGYTTTLKIMQLMAEKGLVDRDVSNRSHVYSAAVAQERTQRNLLSRFVDRAFGGSRSELILRALGDGNATTDELQEIKKLIEKLEQDGTE
ncbi:putative transcriptional regulator [Neolewinella xylanilytica]|uniref:Putative transcriptional regulator n=1 Tax=Neolewinella xylanilytica TaxID=1514080 RepID=A0A2S6I9E0_9BACT|nr:BlaI/MecI/CopY family transcriptional regulator [Neolewinella xylanilytica]PPK88114.1 putative transcriptional regulator [Neolewinella xylanilytica]